MKPVFFTSLKTFFFLDVLKRGKNGSEELIIIYICGTTGIMCCDKCNLQSLRDLDH